MRPAPARAPEPAPSARLRVLARRVERLAAAGRVDPETIVVEMLDIARSLRRMAVELEATPRGGAPGPSWSRPVRRRGACGGSLVIGAKNGK
jgi:hypothetical protein